MTMFGPGKRGRGRPRASRSGNRRYGFMRGGSASPVEDLLQSTDKNHWRELFSSL
jgi:hypothetical protein